MAFPFEIADKRSPFVFDASFIIPARRVRPASHPRPGIFFAINPDLNAMKKPILTVFYDGGCNLCSREIRHYRNLDMAGDIEWVDISSSPARLADFNLTVTVAMAELQVVKDTGEILSGVDAFIAIWSTFRRYRWLASASRLAPVNRVLELAYPVFARWRLKRRCQGSSCNHMRIKMDET